MERNINIVFNNGAGQVANLKLGLTSNPLKYEGWLSFSGVQDDGKTVEASFDLKHVHYYFITHK